MGKPPTSPWPPCCARCGAARDRKSTRLNSSHSQISYAVFCLKKKKNSNCDIASFKHQSNQFMNVYTKYAGISAQQPSRDVKLHHRRCDLDEHTMSSELGANEA